MKAGIAPELLVTQVKNTAAWLWDEPRAAQVAAVLDRAGDAERDREANGPAYLRLLLAAHFATVATFVPTDVDVRIRHHAWAKIDDAAALAAACDVVDEIASWDARWVSARTVEVEGRALSGHDGEWFSVRAGALGRAAVLGAKDLVERLVAQIDAEVEREERALERALGDKAPAQRVLPMTTILAHNLGDLSRVVEQWPKAAELAPLRARFARLGHADGATGRPVLALAGRVNKALMALENHRFLALRKPRGLRASRALLLPIGPWFDAWGEAVAREVGDARERAEVVTSLLELHASSPAQLGCLRALAGLHRATKGGLEVYLDDVPARLRKDALRGRVREALDVTPAHFEARMDKRLQAELGTR